MMRRPVEPNAPCAQQPRVGTGARECARPSGVATADVRGLTLGRTRTRAHTHGRVALVVVSLDPSPVVAARETLVGDLSDPPCVVANGRFDDPSSEAIAATLIPRSSRSATSVRITPGDRFGRVRRLSPAESTGYPQDDAAGSSNGKTPVSGTGYRGSSPCPAASSASCQAATRTGRGSRLFAGFSRGRVKTVALRRPASARAASAGPVLARQYPGYRRAGRFERRVAALALLGESEVDASAGSVQRLLRDHLS
jgi:hypothetical protein